LAFGAPRAGLDLLALVRASMLQPHRGRVDLRELRLQIGAQASRSPSRSDTKYCESANPPTAAAAARTKMKMTGPAGLLRDRLAALALPDFPAPGNAKLNERAAPCEAPIIEAMSGSERCEKSISG